MRGSSTRMLPAAREHGSTEKAPGGRLVSASISAISSELTGVYEAAAVPTQPGPSEECEKGSADYACEEGVRVKRACE